MENEDKRNDMMNSILIEKKRKQNKRKQKYMTIRIINRPNKKTDKQTNKQTKNKQTTK
jgi:hypothetical protein